MIKLVDILKEIKEDITFVKPNFEMEWEEAKRYPALFPNKETWLATARVGETQDVDCSMHIQNTDMCDGDLEDLDPEKVKRVLVALNKGVIELPIVLKIKNDYELLGGNTRLTLLDIHGLPTKAWVIPVA